MVREGFDRQRLAVIPRPLVSEAAALPITRALQVTDAGWFPRAAGHERARANGSTESIMLLCVEGSGWVELAGVRQEVRSPAVVLIPAGAPHRYGASTGTPWTIWWLHLRGESSAELFAEAGTGVSNLADAAQTAELAALAEHVVTALERDPSRAHLVRAAGLAWNLLTLLASRSGSRSGSGSGSGSGSEGAGDDPVPRTMAYLAERLDRAVGVDELARNARVSPSHLGALFRAATGGGVIAYHSTLRMARARQLLDGTEMPIAAIGRATGYADPLYFSRQFRHAHGLSPRAYRAQHKG